MRENRVVFSLKIYKSKLITLTVPTQDASVTVLHYRHLRDVALP